MALLSVNMWNISIVQESTIIIQGLCSLNISVLISETMMHERIIGEKFCERSKQSEDRDNLWITVKISNLKKEGKW